MWLVRLVFVLVIMAQSGSAWATSRAQADAGITAYEQGKAKLAEGDTEQAYLLFWEADALYPGALPKYWQAHCLDQLGERADAVVAYRAFLDSQPGAKHRELIDEARARITALEAKRKRPAKRPDKRADKRAAKRKRKPKRKQLRPAATQTAPDEPNDDRTAMKAAGFTLLAAALGSGAGLAASFAQAHNAPSASDRNAYATATQVLVPVTAGLLLTTAIVLPLSYSDLGEDEPQAQLKVGATSATVSVSF